MTSSDGCKSFEMCTNCSSEPASPAHIVEFLELTKQDLADHPLMVLDFSKVYDIMDMGCGSPVVRVSDHGRYVVSSSPVPLKTRRVGQRCTLNLSSAETSSGLCGVVVRREGVPAQVSSTSLDHDSKLRGPSPKALV
ncbi:uncharacterized protein TNCV_111431 [Trichonephila clavipes]|nr:uncharacterized protein TNCV_111431 [Trichonephila clavipes]